VRQKGKRRPIHSAGLRAAKLGRTTPTKDLRRRETGWRELDPLAERNAFRLSNTGIEGGIVEGGADGDSATIKKGKEKRARSGCCLGSANYAGFY